MIAAMMSEYAAPKLCTSFRIITIGRYFKIKNANKW